jgi:hypothetical protein
LRAFAYQHGQRESVASWYFPHDVTDTQVKRTLEFWGNSEAGKTAKLEANQCMGPGCKAPREGHCRFCPSCARVVAQSTERTRDAFK